MEEEEELMPEEGGEGGSPTEGLATVEEQVPKLQVNLPAAPGF